MSIVMFSGKRMAVLICGLTFCTLLISSAAFGHSIYQGADLSFVTNYDRTAWACDQERDGHSVYTSYAWGIGGYYRGEVIDLNGSGSGTCVAETISSTIQYHRTCEDGSNGSGDICTYWEREPH